MADNKEALPVLMCAINSAAVGDDPDWREVQEQYRENADVVRFCDHATATAALSELRAEVERYRAAMMKIMWLRTPGGSPSKYQYEVECIAAKVLGSEAFTAAAARSAASGESAEGGV